MSSLRGISGKKGAKLLVLCPANPLNNSIQSRRADLSPRGALAQQLDPNCGAEAPRGINPALQNAPRVLEICDEFPGHDTSDRGRPTVAFFNLLSMYHPSS